MIYSEETFATYQEAKELIRLNVDETGFDKELFNLDLNMYEVMDSVGMLKVYTAREYGVLVGYAVFVVVESQLHYKGIKAATNDVLFIAPEHRKGSAGFKLLKYAEQKLRGIGVRILSIGITDKRDWGRIAERMGYIPSERIYFKRI